MKNIIFDLGGVIINVDYQLSVDAFKNLGIDNFDCLYSQAGQTKLFDHFETGKITPAQFRSEIKKFLPPKTTSTQINKCWNAMLLDFPNERLKLLEKLQKKYRLFLLSNTNKIHINEVSKILKRKNQLKIWSRVFKKKYFSHEIGMRKPDKEVYDFVLKENNLKATETLFIDDSEQNILGAKKAGLKTYFLKKGEEITQLSILK